MSALPLISDALLEGCTRHVTEALYARHGRELERFGPRGRQVCSQDIGRHLDCLQAVLQTGQPQAFVDYAVWLQNVLQGRGMASIYLDYTLEQMGSFLASGSPGALADEVTQVIATARDTLRAGGAVARYGTLRLAPLAQAPTYQNALINGDRRGAAASLTDAMDEGQSLTSACVQIVQPAMYQIGNLWQDGSITVSQEHLATAISESAMVAAYTRAEFLPLIGKTAMFACVESNYHNLGLRMLSDAFETCGWDVVYLGASVPSRDLLVEVDRRRPALLALSVALPQHLVGARATIDKLRAELGQASPTIWIGGLAVQSEAQVRMVGADGWAADAAQALEQL